jgi:hypothetical protein
VSASEAEGYWFESSRGYFSAARRKSFAASHKRLGHRRLRNATLARVGTDEIVRAYPQITLSDIHAALAYYWDHKHEIDQQMKEADEFVAELKKASSLSPLARKLAATESGSDRIPS